MNAIKTASSGMVFSTTFNTSLQSDIMALTNFQNAIQSGMGYQEAFDATMRQASADAQLFTNSIWTATASVQDFEVQQRLAQVTTMAQCKSLVSAKSLIAEYNNNCVNVGSTQTEFINAIRQSNAGLANYLSGLNGANGSLGGYIGSLVRAKVATIAMQTATMALNMAITMGLSLAITALINAISHWVNAAKEARQANIETGDTAAKAGKEIDDAVNKYLEAKKAMDDGTISSDEFADAQNNVLSVLNLTGQGIDTLIGKYGDLETAILDVAKAETNVSSALAGAKSAEEEALKELETVWGKYSGVYISTFKSNKEEKSAFKDLADAGFLTYSDALGNNVILPRGTLVTDFDKATFEGMLENYRYLEEVMNFLSKDYADTQVFSDVAALYSQYQSVLEPALESIDNSNTLIAKRLLMDSELKNDITDLQGYIELRNELISQLENDDRFDKNGTATAEGIVDSILMQSDAFKTYALEYQNSVEQVQKVETNAVETSKETLQSFKKLLNDKGTEKDPHFIDRVDDYVEKINKLNSAYKDLSEGNFSDEDFSKLIRDFPELTTRADDLGVAINEIKDAMNSEIYADFANQFGNMETEEDVAALEAYRDAVLNVGKTVDDATSLFAGDSNKTQKIIDNASKIQSILNSQKNGKSVALEDFNSEEFKDYKKALEYVNGAVQLNEEKVVEITKAKAKEQIAINKSNKAMSNVRYIENARQIEKYTKALSQATQQRDKLEWQSKIDSLTKENEEIAEACKQYDFLSKTLQEATDSYQHWLNAQSASDYGDMMSDTEDAIKLISDTLDEASDIYGQFGSKKYQAALDLIIPDSVDHDSITAVKQYMTNLKKYFYFDEDGAIAGMDIQGFIQKSLNAGLMVFDSANQEYKIAGGKTMESFAEGLKLSSGMVQAFFDEMQLYGGKFDWSDEIGKSIDEIYAGIESLDNLPHFKDINLKLDFSDIDTAEEQIKAVDKEIEKVDKIKATPNINASEIEYANDILILLLREKQSLEAPAIMDVDTSNVDSKYRDAISLAQEYQQALNDKEILTKLGIDTTDTDKQMTEIEGKIKKIDPKIKAELNLDTTNKDGIVEFIKNFDPNKYPKIVRFKADTTEVDDASKEVSKPIDRNVHYHAVNLDSLPDHFSDIVRKVRYEIDGDTDVSGYANGTAHASGTAKAGGDWGTARGGRTLVGELGRKYFAPVYSDIYYKFI